MPIEELVEPYWNKQPGETPKQHCWFCQFLQYPDFNIGEFHKYISSPEFNPPDKAGYGKIPTIKTIYNWSSDNKWKHRKTRYLEDREEQVQQQLLQLDIEKRKEFYNQKIELISAAFDKTHEEFLTGKISGYQFNQYCQGITKLLDDNRLDLNKSTDIVTSNANVELDATVESDNGKADEILKLLEEARHGSE